ncbi:hypothetical protein DM02DRAFT_614628 [Periconia macrospinosa]|uniref:Uncharacterized protein n=1 Tax=Periconia macrospinosa TaxID=97972 RepID=A0A2V1DP64_9PLEO|nr:hypothetical protein DM02DRAFT_614628 [Periconia macrospinosa]
MDYSGVGDLFSNQRSFDEMSLDSLCPDGDSCAEDAFARLAGMEERVQGLRRELSRQQSQIRDMQRQIEYLCQQRQTEALCQHQHRAFSLRRATVCSPAPCVAKKRRYSEMCAERGTAERGRKRARHA